MNSNNSAFSNPNSAFAKPLRVLIIEDSEDDTLLLLRELRKGWDRTVYERVETPQAMRAALSKQEWDIIISDYVLPQFSGLAALEVLRESGQDLPFIIVSGKIGEDIAVTAMKAGAHDYIIKGNLARLVPAVERELREAASRFNRRHVEEELEHYRHHLEEMVEKRTAELQAANGQLQKAFDEVKTLRGFLPICASCKKYATTRDIGPNWSYTFMSIQMFNFPMVFVRNALLNSIPNISVKTQSQLRTLLKEKTNRMISGKQFGNAGL
jgi:DNA-binding response OmpR family regulator